jgi:hypothetical protein
VACKSKGNQSVILIFSDSIWEWIRLEEFWSVRIWVRIFNIRYHIRIWIIKSYIYDVDIQSYHIRHGWQYPYSDPNPNKNMKINITSVIYVRIWSVFIHAPVQYTMERQNLRLTSYYHLYVAEQGFREKEINACISSGSNSLSNWWEEERGKIIGVLFYYGCVHFAKSRRKVTVASFVVIWQNLSNHGLNRLKRFVPTFTDKLCN